MTQSVVYEYGMGGCAVVVWHGLRGAGMAPAVWAHLQRSYGAERYGDRGDPCKVAMTIEVSGQKERILSHRGGTDSQGCYRRWECSSTSHLRRLGQ
jgi:hypothetical protein